MTRDQVRNQIKKGGMYGVSCNKRISHEIKNRKFIEIEEIEEMEERGFSLEQENQVQEGIRKFKLIDENGTFLQNTSTDSGGNANPNASNAISGNGGLQTQSGMLSTASTMSMPMSNPMTMQHVSNPMQQQQQQSMQPMDVIMSSSTPMAMSSSHSVMSTMSSSIGTPTIMSTHSADTQPVDMSSSSSSNQLQQQNSQLSNPTVPDTSTPIHIDIPSSNNNYTSSPDVIADLQSKLLNANQEAAFHKMSHEASQTMIRSMKVEHDSSLKDLRAEVGRLEGLLISKDAKINELDQELKETMKRLDKVNAYVANKVVNQAQIEQTQQQFSIPINVPLNMGMTSGMSSGSPLGDQMSFFNSSQMHMQLPTANANVLQPLTTMPAVNTMQQQSAVNSLQQAVNSIQSMQSSNPVSVLHQQLEQQMQQQQQQQQNVNSMQSVNAMQSVNPMQQQQQQPQSVNSMQQSNSMQSANPISVLHQQLEQQMQQQQNVNSMQSVNVNSMQSVNSLQQQQQQQQSVNSMQQSNPVSVLHQQLEQQLQQQSVQSLQQSVNSIQQSNSSSLFDQQMQQQAINSIQMQASTQQQQQGVQQSGAGSVFDQQMQQQNVNSMQQQSVNSMQQQSVNSMQQQTTMQQQPTIFEQQMQQQSTAMQQQLEQQIHQMTSIPPTSVFDQPQMGSVFAEAQTVFDSTPLEKSGVFEEKPVSTSVFDQQIDVSSFKPADELPVVEEVKVLLYTGTKPPTFGEGDVLMDPASLASIIQAEAAKAAESQPPPFKKQKMEWKPADNSLLTEAVEACGSAWESVGERLGRSAADCEAQWIAIQPRKGKWEKDEDEKLVAAYKDVYEGEATPPNTAGMMFWYKVAGFIPGRSGVQCMARYNETLDPSLKKGKWDPEEDVLLLEAYAKYGKSWVKISTAIPGRTQRQCRTRFCKMEAKGDVVLPTPAAAGARIRRVKKEEEDDGEEEIEEVEEEVKSPRETESLFDIDSDAYDHDEDL